MDTLLGGAPLLAKTDAQAKRSKKLRTDDEASTFLLLRYVLIIAAAYLFLFGGEPGASADRLLDARVTGVIGVGEDRGGTLPGAGLDLVEHRHDAAHVAADVGDPRTDDGARPAVGCAGNAMSNSLAMVSAYASNPSRASSKYPTASVSR